MAVNPISSNIVNLLSPQPLLSGNSVTKPDGSFADIFTEALNTVSATDMVSKGHNLALLAGQTDDLAGIMIDAQKAEVALSLALSLRNKVLEAYTEIMRMQV